MSNDKYHDDILTIITEKGEMGVNEIARAINVPLSTVQKYLERQTYFKKTERRKWDLPEHVNQDIKSDTLSLMVDSVENALKLLNAQMSEIQLSIQNSLIPVNTLKRAVNAAITPVAGKSVNVDKKLIKLEEDAHDIEKVFKKFKDKLPEIYKDLVLNVDMVWLSISKGTEYVKGNFTQEISALLVEQSNTLSDDVLDALKLYQKEA